MLNKSLERQRLLGEEGVQTICKALEGARGKALLEQDTTLIIGSSSTLLHTPEKDD